MNETSDIKFREAGYEGSLFRYRNNDNAYFLGELESAIIQRKIYLAGTEQINDPFEFTPSYIKPTLREVNKLLKEKFRHRPILAKRRADQLAGRPLTRNEFRKFGKKNKANPTSAAIEMKIMEKVFQDFPKRVRLACFSEKSDCAPMWAHYANNHAGICIEYDLRVEEALPEEPLPFMVKYSSDRPALTHKEVFEFSQRGIRNENTAVAERAFTGIFLTKAKDWSYEREWRLIDNSNRVAGYQRVSSLVPRRVLLGFRASRDLEKEVRACVAETVPVFSASIDDKSFSMNFCQIG